MCPCASLWPTEQVGYLAKPDQEYSAAVPVFLNRCPQLWTPKEHKRLLRMSIFPKTFFCYLWEHVRNWCPHRPLTSVAASQSVLTIA